uniref:CSON009210 protein n=1 Tax=Culicoides sonorensis TaxID=179676 RepID=A0A336LGK4_CULSO
MGVCLLFLKILVIDILSVSPQSFEHDPIQYPISQFQSLIPPFNYSLDTWIFRGSSINSRGTIPLTEPSTCSRKSVWSKLPNLAESWKLELDYISYNENENAPNADGMALWYLPPSFQDNYDSHQLTYGGPTGAFTGLLVVIDPYQGVGDRLIERNKDQSVVAVIYNEFPRTYNFRNEGVDEKLGGCLVTNRYNNRTETISTLALEYADNKLRVYHSNGSRLLETCDTVDVKLPLGYNFGVSAANGGIPGVFELISFKFYPSATSEKPKLPHKIDYTYILTGCLTLALILLTSSCILLWKKNREIKQLKNEDSYYAYYQEGNSGQPANVPQSAVMTRRARLPHYADPNLIEGKIQTSMNNFESQDGDEYDHLNFNR